MTFFDSQPQPTGGNSPVQTIGGVLEPELMRPTPRQARYTSFTQLSHVIGIALWLFFTGNLFYCASRDAGELKRLVSNGQATAAPVSEKYISGRRKSRYFVDYEYRVGQTTYSGEEEVSYRIYLDTSIGDELPITYDRDDPKVYRLGAVTVDMANHAVGIYVVLIGVVSTLLALFLAFIETTNKRQMLLLQVGIAATATVTDKGSRNTGNTTIYSLSYAFDVDGETVQNTLAVPYDMQEYLQPGSQFSVLYMPGNPGESVPYRAIRNAALSLR